MSYVGPVYDLARFLRDNRDFLNSDEDMKKHVEHSHAYLERRMEIRKINWNSEFFGSKKRSKKKSKKRSKKKRSRNKSRR